MGTLTLLDGRKTPCQEALLFELETVCWHPAALKTAKPGAKPTSNQLLQTVPGQTDEDRPMIDIHFKFVAMASFHMFFDQVFIQSLHHVLQ